MRIPPLRLPFDVTFAMPGSKSHANRAIVAACLAEGRTVIRRATPCDDVRLLVDNLRKMGFAVAWTDERDGVLAIDGGLPVAPPESDPIELDCGLAGTALRFLTAVACLVPGEWIVTGNARMRQRPIGPLVDALRALGADVDATDGHPPIRVTGGLRTGGTVTLDASASSQFLTALLLIAPRLDGGLRIAPSAAVASRPYVELTANVLATFGATVTRDDDALLVPGTGLRSPSDVEIEGDWSAAGVWLAITELTRSRFTAPNLDLESPQGDRSIPVHLAMMREPGHVRIDVRDVPDQLMNLAAVAALRDGRTTFTGAANLRLKESDRLDAVAQGWRTLGVTIDATDDGLVVDGPARLRAGEVETRGDHRLAMAFAILGSLVDGVEIDDAACVSKSYPAFFDDLRSAHAPSSARCVAVVGMRGAGKTTLAAALAERLELQFADSDALFESAHGDLTAYVETHGWDAFRAVESGLVADCLAPGRVVAVGGGSLETTSTLDLLRHRALVVWVRESADTLVERLRGSGRPALTASPLEQEVRTVLGRREPSWEAVADLALPPGGTIAERVAAVETWLREPFARHTG